MVMAEEYGDWEESHRRIDLLALDRSADLVVIELKRTHDGNHMELQALRYAVLDYLLLGHMSLFTIRTYVLI